VRPHEAFYTSSNYLRNSAFAFFVRAGSSYP